MHQNFIITTFLIPRETVLCKSYLLETQIFNQDSSNINLNYFLNAHANIAATTKFTTNPLLNRVQKIADVRKLYKIADKYSWTQFSEILITIDLQFSKFVTVRYVIATQMTCACTFHTTAYIDKKQTRQFRRGLHSGYKYTSNAGCKSKKRNHTLFKAITKPTLPKISEIEIETWVGLLAQSGLLDYLIYTAMQYSRRFMSSFHPTLDKYFLFVV